MRFLERHAVAVAMAVAIVTAHPVCNLFFRCGCDITGPHACNIHHPTGPHCPWCTTRWAFVLVGAAWLGGTWAAVALARKIGGRRPATSIAAGLLGLALAMLASGVVTYLVSGYPHFL